MQSKATTVEDYIKELPEDRKAPVKKLRAEIKKNLPKGFKEVMSYGMIGYVVPHSLYPEGYHCNPEQPLPFMGLASQKHFIAVYSMCVYSDKKILDWFSKEYSNLGIGKLDMGKGCIRFKNMGKISYKLIGELCTKMTAQEWIAHYTKIIKR
jgi:uncharacterized protein YdhG (YjbR/CyaY superfamily)